MIRDPKILSTINRIFLWYREKLNKRQNSYNKKSYVRPLWTVSCWLSEYQRILSIYLIFDHI